MYFSITVGWMKVLMRHRERPADVMRRVMLVVMTNNERTNMELKKCLLRRWREGDVK